MAPTTGRLDEQSAVRTLTLGRTHLTYVVDGAMELDTVGFFPAIPKSYWDSHPEALAPSGRVPTSVGGVLVRRNGRNLLIDTGLGTSTLAADLGVSRAGAFLGTLKALHTPPEDITAVAFTHLHTDHTGWGFVPDAAGTMRKTFPRATYYVAGLEWDPYWRGEITVGAPSRTGFVEPMAKVLTRIDDGQDVWPGVTALVTPGHSPGHTTYAVADPDTGQRVLVLGDAFHTPAQMTHPEWTSGPDTDVKGVRTARARLLAELDEPGTLGFAFHFGDQAFGRVVRDAAGLRAWEPVPAEALLPAPLQVT